jgi:cytochrome c-type biogenesis protein CcmF
LGLNPILQDPALAIHPPMLYLGYVGSSIIFSSVLAATSLNYISNTWATHIKQWVLISWIFLTLGILLGSIWAYYELGWGGFWFWDPVENVSLMPWLALTTLLHCVLVLEKRSVLKSWVIILSITTFTLSMCGTFLVRSGILNSVHTFANDPERGLFILSFLFVLIFISLFVFFVFHKSDKEEIISFSLFSKETSILINNWLMMYFLSVVLIGTVYPIFLDVISSEQISVGPPFYHKLIIPFLIPFLIFMAVGPQLRWIKSTALEGKKYLIFFLIVSFVISFLIIKNFGNNLLINTVLIGSALYLFFITVRDFFKKRLQSFSQNLAHFGFSLLILSILFNNIFSNEVITNLKVGESFKNDNFTIEFNDLRKFEESNYISFKGYFLIDDNNSLEKLEPELRVYNQPNIITSEADIKITFLSDKFITMNTVQNEEYFNIRYQVKPFMLWIWISVLLIAVGGFMSLFKRKIL